jgi:hypothetical protein
MAINELIDAVERATVETILEVSAEPVINRGSQEKLEQEKWGERGGSQAGFISAIKSWQSSSLATPAGRGVDKEVTVSACAARQNRNMQNTNFGNPDECVQGRGVLGVIDGNSPNVWRVNRMLLGDTTYCAKSSTNASGICGPHGVPTRTPATPLVRSCVD